MVKERVLQHSHSSTAEEKSLAADRTAKAISRLKAELVLWPETERELAERDGLAERDRLAGRDDSRRRNTRLKSTPVKLPFTAEIFPSAKAVAKEIAELTSSRVSLAVFPRLPAGYET